MNRTARVFQVRVRRDFCKGCGLCIEFCKPGVLEFSDERNVQGYYPPRVINQEACVGCMACVLVCPDLALEVHGE